MPYASLWQEPMLTLEHAGVVVHVDYKDDDYEQPYQFHYRLYPYDEDEQLGVQVANDEDAKKFDVRDLPTFTPTRTHAQVMQQAIDAGQLTQEGIR